MSYSDRTDISQHHPQISLFWGHKVSRVPSMAPRACLSRLAKRGSAPTESLISQKSGLAETLPPSTRDVSWSSRLLAHCRVQYSTGVRCAQCAGKKKLDDLRRSGPERHMERAQLRVACIRTSPSPPSIFFTAI